MKRAILYTLAFCAAIALLTAGSPAEELPELQFEKYELPNGLDVILYEDHTIPMVSVNIWYHVGSKNETPGRTGFAHLFEHLMFEGSGHHQGKFTESIIKYGGTRNGSTNSDRTNYWENMPSNYLEKTLWLEADRMGYLLDAVDQENLDLQRSVVKNEKRQNTDDQPYGMVNETVRKLIYPPSHPYSWTTIGLMEDLDAASLEDVHAFNRRFYTPNNASLCVAGDFDPAETKAWIEKYFGHLPPGPPVERLAQWVPRLDAEIRAAIEDEVQLPRLDMVWHTPAYYAPGDAEFDLLASVLSTGKSSRLYRTLVYEKQMAQNVVAYQASREIASTFHISVTPSPGTSLEQIEAEVDRILYDLLDNGITPEEFERAQVNWETGFVRQLETIGGFGGLADRLNGYNTFLGDPGMLKWDQARYINPTADDVIRFAREYLKPDARLVLSVVPLGQLAQSDVTVDMNQEPGHETERSFTPPNIQRTTLSNGMELCVVENHRLPLVQMNLVIKSGWAADPVDRPGASSLTAELLNEGTKNRTALEISSDAQMLGVGIGINSNFDNTTIGLNSLKENLDDALDLAADILLNPTFPADELERQRQIYLGAIRQEKAQAFTVAFKSFFRELYGAAHPYGQPYTGSGTESSINAITRDDLVAYYRANYVPNNAAAILVGDITLNEAKKKLERAFKGWRKGNVAQTTVAAVTPPARPKICIVDQPGTSQSAIVLGNLIGSRKDPSFIEAQVVTQVLGGGPAGRLYRNLREDKGYTYGSYSLTTGRVGQGAIVAYAQVQTDVTKDALAEFMREIRGITGEIPVTEQELGENKDQLIKSFPQNFQTIGGVAGQLATTMTFDLPMDRWNSYIDQVRSVDREEFLRTAREYVKPDEMLIVVVGDRDKIESGIRELNLGDIYYADTQ